jgi:hypothetical protein
MSDQNEQDAAKSRLSLRPAGRLEMGKTVDAGSVRQSFSHGRSKVVQVEVVKKRTPGPGGSGTTLRAQRLEKPRRCRHHTALALHRFHDNGRDVCAHLRTNRVEIPVRDVNDAVDASEALAVFRRSRQRNGAHRATMKCTLGSNNTNFSSTT